MTAIHLKAPGIASDWIAASVESALSRVAGVIKVALVRSADLVSVLFDETRSSAEQILHALWTTGVDARLCLPAASS